MHMFSAAAQRSDIAPQSRNAIMMAMHYDAYDRSDGGAPDCASLPDLEAYD